MYTGQQKDLEQPKFCSSFMDKIWSHKRSPDVRDRGKSPEKKKAKSENSEKSNVDKDNKKSEIKTITTKLKKVTSTLPSALRSNEAYGPGEKNCEVCSMTREKYKSDLQSAKVVGILVDGVVEKEQVEKMDEESEQEEVDEEKDKLSKENGKGDKISFNLSVYCEGDVIKHNLKCVLIKLQKTLGDLMVQICFVKTRKLGNEERYKKFNVSTSDLKLLKFEYTNLTDAIIPLFKTSSAKKKNNTDACVACAKEKLCEYNMRLGEILKSGRNLRVVMRNDGASQGADKCCARDYPHVHAEVQGKPIVLKYSMPFQVKPSSKPDGPSDKPVQMDPSGRPISFEQTSSETAHPSSPQEVPYYEWPEDYINQDSKIEPTDAESPTPAPPERKNTSDSESVDSLEDKPKVPENFPGKALQPRDEINSPKTKQRPESSDSSITFQISSVSSKESNVPKASGPLAIKPKSTTQIAAPALSKTSLFSKKSAKSAASRKTPPPKSKEKRSVSDNSDSSESDYRASAHSKKSTPSSLYCGCNYDKAIKKLDSQPKSKSNPRTTKNEDSWSSESESITSFLKDDSSKKKEDKTFPYQINNTTAFPVSTTQSMNFPKQSSKVDYFADPRSSHSQQHKPVKNADEREDKDNNVQERVNAVDSLLLTKERLSHGGEPLDNAVRMSTSPEDKAVAAAFKTFIDEPKYEIRRVSTTDNNSVNPNKDISHRNKKLELLKQFGSDNLMNVCSPAECCKTNKCLDIKNSYNELPLSPSLYSLPLNHSDLEYLAKATGTPISYEDLMLLAEEEIPAKNNEWEVHYADNNNDQYKSKWLRAVDGTHEERETCNNTHPTAQTNSSPIRRNSVKSVVIKEEPRLSTIIEEGPFCFYEDERPSIPYMPSIPSLPLDEEEKAELIKKQRPSILKHTTMELRYFTVEFPDKMFSNQEKKETCHEGVGKSNDETLRKNTLPFGVRTGNETNKGVKVQALSKGEDSKKSCESFHSCCSSTELMNINYDQMKGISCDELFSHQTDKIIMLNAIHLCDETFDCYNNTNNVEIKLSRNCEQNITLNNNIVNSQNPNFSECKMSCIGPTHEINDCYVKNLISKEDKTQRAAINKSYTVIKNTESEKPCFDHMNDKMSQTNAVTGFTNSDKLCSVTRDSKIISMNENTPKYISVKSNQSYTIVKNPNQSINNKVGFSYKIENNPQISYTVIKDKDKTDTVENKPTLKIYSEIENISLKNHFPSLTVKANNAPQYDKTYKQSNWSKLKLDKSNVKNYVCEQINNKQMTSLHETNTRHFRDYKRKPMILAQSGINYKRMRCKVSLPRFYFPNLQPVRVSYRIPSIVFKPNKRSKKFETLEGKKELKQKINNNREHFSSLTHVEKKIHNILKSEPEQTFVQRIENKCNFQDIKQVEALKKNSSTKNIHKPEHNMISFDDKTGNCYYDSLNFTNQLLENKKSVRFFTVKSNTNLKYPQEKVDSSKTDEHLLIDGHNNPLYLFDSHGRPLTDQSGRTLRSVQGESLIIFDKQNNPICDLDNNPICDSLGRIFNKKGFNSVKPPIEDVLKSFVKDSGEPILLYDTEGRPLTSISGTMLVDSSGKSLIRFGCTDKLLSDSTGRSVFNVNGKQFNGVG